ncbi:tyrosine-protein kinase transmembrane receptor Ror2 [Trichonephila clavipes]|nr:tyrosine-protein kinase transmembrane receptor Ror2 [Trichonephila clavipes]
MSPSRATTQTSILRGILSISPLMAARGYRSKVMSTSVLKSSSVCPGDPQLISHPMRSNSESSTEVIDQQSEPTQSNVRRPPQDTPQGYCSLYTGSTCRKYLPSSGLVYYNFSTDGSATPINEQITQGLWKEVISSLLEPCRTAAETLLCHYAFPACEWIDGFAYSKPLCREDCIAVQDLFCYNEWAMIEDNKQRGIYFKSRGHFRLPDCNALPERGNSSSSGVCSHAHLTDIIEEEVTEYCIRDRGRFYQGTMNVTKSGIPCQKWDSQKDYDEQFTKTLLETIIETRVLAERDEKEENDYKRKQEGLILKLERMKLSITATSTNTSAAAAEKINIQHLIPRFVENSDISTYLKIFERQCELVNIGEVDYVTHLLPMLPYDISHNILREPKEKLENYQHIKQVLLQRFKLSAESFRMKFTTHQKQPEALWNDFAYELSNYLEGGLHSLEVKDFNSLKDLVLTDQLKKRVSKEVKEHFVDIWGDIKSSSELVQKLDDYEIAREDIRNLKADILCPAMDAESSATSSQNALTAISQRRDPAHFGILRINSLSPSNRNAVLRISINGVSGTAFADSGASHSIAGETLYTILLQQGAAFEKTAISISFADGIVTQKEILRTFQTVILEGRKFKTPFINLSDSKNNSYLLGVDFLENAGIVLNFRKKCWTFCDDSQKSYNFLTPYQSTSVNVRPVAINNCQLRKDEGQELGSQCAELDSLLENHHSIFEVRGEAIPFIEHSINTENNPPISVPPYQMNATRKELLNSAKCDTTGKTAAHLQLRREMRTIDDVTNDFRSFIDNENFVPETTPYLKRLARISSEVRKRIEEKQDQRKTYDKRHRLGPLYRPGDNVWVTLHNLSNAAHKKTAKFISKRDEPYIIGTQRSQTTYEVANPNNPHEVLGPYHSSVLRSCIDKKATPVMPLRKRERPRKDNSAGFSSRAIPRNQRGSVTNGNRAPSPGRMGK